MDGGLVEVVGIADAVEARHRRHDHDVAAAGQQGRRGAQPQFFDFVVDAEVFLDIGVGGRQVGFGLVVVVVGDEIFDEVFGEEVFEFAVQLGGQGLVVAQDKGRPVQPGDDVGHGERLARPGHAHKCRGRVALPNGGNNLLDGGRLVARRLIRRCQFKIHLRSSCPTPIGHLFISFLSLSLSFRFLRQLFVDILRGRRRFSRR